MELLELTVAAKAMAGLVVLYLLIMAGARAIERGLMYFPDPQRTAPAAAGLAGVEEIAIESEDGASVLAWWGRSQPGNPTLLYFHGNAGSLEQRSERIRKYMARGYGVFMMAYRGFSGSTGQPSEEANVGDAKRAYDLLVSRGVAPRDIVLYGESLGSGIAVQVAAERSVAGIVLDAPYTSMADLASLHYRFLPTRLLLNDTYLSDTFIGRVRAPLLIVHGEADDIIPVDMGRKLYALAEEPKEIVTFPGAGHSDHYLFGSYDTIYDWLERLSERATEPRREPPSAAVR